MTWSSVRGLGAIALVAVMLPTIPAWGICPGPNDCFRGDNCDQYIGDGTVCTVDACGAGGNGTCGFVIGSAVKQCRRQPGQTSCPTVECNSATCPLPPGCDRAGLCIRQGTCIQTPAPGQACNDSNVCTTNDVCIGAASLVCAGTPTTGNVCRPAAGPCDPAETCPAAAPSCPADAFLPDTTVCRPAVGLCDAAETCSGSSAACPADGLASNTTVCRAAAGACDVAETCTGASAACPADTLAPDTTVCRAAAGACDVAETCTGISPACPVNGFAPNTTVCRAAAGACDVAETCSGASAACPADGFASNTTVCRVAAGVCDVAETCTGTSAACPADGFAPNTTVCRAAAGACDVAETCTGASAACPANVGLPNAPCTDDGNPCTDDVCDGAGACQHVANTAACDDGDACTQIDRCRGGVCIGSNRLSCPGADQCHEASVCDPRTGTCSVAAATSCDDGDPCTTDGCDPSAGCTHPPAQDGAPCDDGQVCTENESCLAGGCAGGTFSCGRIDTKPEVPVRGNDPVLKLTCETAADAGGTEPGSCEATGFVDPGSEPAAAGPSERAAATVARIEALDPSDAGAVTPLGPATLAEAPSGTQVTRTVRRRLNRRGRVILKLRLNPVGKRLLKESGRLRVRFAVGVVDRSGRSTSVQLFVDLLRLRRRG